MDTDMDMDMEPSIVCMWDMVIDGSNWPGRDRAGARVEEETNIIYKSIKSIWVLRPNKLPTGRTGQIGILLRITHAADQL